MAADPSEFSEPADAPPVPSGEAAPASFEDAMRELETLVSQMESGALPLEASLAAYRRGAELVHWCRRSLADVEQQVRVLEDGMLRPLDADEAGRG